MSFKLEDQVNFLSELSVFLSVEASAINRMEKSLTEIANSDILAVSCKSIMVEVVEQQKDWFIQKASEELKCRLEKFEQLQINLHLFMGIVGDLESK